VRPHMALENHTPAEMAAIPIQLGTNRWLDSRSPDSLTGGESLVSKKDATWEKRPTIEIRVGRSIHSVNLQPSGDNRVKFTTDADADSKAIGREIIRLCELGYQADRVGLTIGDIRSSQRHFVIRPSAP
jgi:hypothetical protein